MRRRRARADTELSPSQSKLLPLTTAPALRIEPDPDPEARERVPDRGPCRPGPRTANAPVPTHVFPTDGFEPPRSAIATCTLQSTYWAHTFVNYQTHRWMSGRCRCCMYCSCGPHGQRQAAQMATERTQCGVGRRRATLVQLVMREIWRRGLHSMLSLRFRVSRRTGPRAISTNASRTNRRSWS